MSALTDMGFNFRSSGGYVTDASNMVPVLVEAYAHTYTASDGQSTAGGWEEAPDGGADRNSALDARLAGMNYFSNNSAGKHFRIDLPAAGDYAVALAVGDTATTNTVWSLIVQDTTTTRLTLASGTIGTLAANQYCDASGVIRTSAADWVTNSATVTLTFASTICRLFIGSLASGDFTTLAHARLTAVAAGGGLLLRQGDRLRGHLQTLSGGVG